MVENKNRINFYLFISKIIIFVSFVLIFILSFFKYGLEYVGVFQYEVNYYNSSYIIWTLLSFVSFLSLFILSYLYRLGKYERTIESQSIFITLNVLTTLFSFANLIEIIRGAGEPLFAGYLIFFLLSLINFVILFMLVTNVVSLFNLIMIKQNAKKERTGAKMIEKLKELYDNDLLTKEEFEEKKAKYLEKNVKKE